MKQLLNTFELHDKRYLIKKDTIDISNFTDVQVHRMLKLIESSGLVWEYLNLKKPSEALEVCKLVNELCNGYKQSKNWSKGYVTNKFNKICILANEAINKAEGK